MTYIHQILLRHLADPKSVCATRTLLTFPRLVAASTLHRRESYFSPTDLPVQKQKNS